MKRSILLLVLGLARVLAQGEEGLQWFTDVNAAREKARSENKFILLDFTGSDWCGWCIKLKNEVFVQPEFASFARAHLVLVELDFPRHKQLDAAQVEANERLAATFHIEGYPTIILLDQNGNQVGQTGYMPGGPQAFDANLAEMLKIDNKSAPAPDTKSPPPAPKLVNTSVPLGAAGVSNYYGALKLKGISGDKDHRMVLINNATLVVGETATVKVQSRKVEVVCKEIREKSVLVTVDGKETELTLGNH